MSKLQVPVKRVVAAQRIADKFAGMTLPKEKCTRCNRVVYATEKQQSAKGAVFHKQCFSCAEPSCRQKLNHNNARTNPNGMDAEIYCQGHVPKMGSVGIGPDAMNMMRLKQYGDMQKKLNKRATLKAARLDYNAYGIQSAMNSQSLLDDKRDFDQSDHHFPAVLMDAKDQYQLNLRERQEELEKKQKEEEDLLFKKFEEERKKAAAEAERESKIEWDSKLQDIIAMHERQGIDQNELEKRRLQMQSEQEAKMNKLMKNKTMRVIQKQQQETSALVDKQSDEMLKLIKDEKEQLAKNMHNKLENAKHQIDEGEFDSDAVGWLGSLGEENLNIEEVVTEIIGSTEAPAPRAPRSRKSDIMPDDGDEEFNRVFDNHVAKVAEDEQTTFTELVHILTGPFMDDLSKARAIYRWITYKDLNKMEFTAENTDSPMGLMRGIKYGTETYHTLFKRLCSYAGLHCVEVHGKSKSVGYEPGMKFETNAFRNTWNAVSIDGEWRLVQCNWGARFLVINKDKNENKTAEMKKQDDSIKYQYDEHYFLTDAQDFIREFFPNDSSWQLLPKPITQAEFENLPLVRSIFFHLGLKFKKNYPAVLDTTETGGADVRILVPAEIAQDTAFLYQLRFSDRERAAQTEYSGAKLDRFIYQSMHDNEVVYSGHVPTTGEYFLQIFASKMDNTKPGGATSMEGVKLKCVCKFKIICNKMEDKMLPLPNCAPGEWGPKKCQRQYNMTPVSHPKGVIQTENNLKVKFLLGMPLVFLAKLKMNDVDDRFFEDFVDAQFDDEHLRVKIGFPMEGQYGLDIYAKHKDAPPDKPLAHACKYLINVTKVQNPIDFGLAKLDNAIESCMGNWGPQPAMNNFGLQAVSHTNWRLKTETQQVIVRFQAPAGVILSCHFVKEPEYDYKDHVQIQRENDQITTFTLRGLTHTGNYMLMLFARMDTDDSVSYTNVFNYLVKVMKPTTAMIK